MRERVYAASTWIDVGTDLILAADEDVFWDAQLWYDQFLSDAPPDWKLLKQIALMEPEDWEGDDAPQKVAAQIVEIKERLDDPSTDVLQKQSAPSTQTVIFKRKFWRLLD